VVAAVGVDRAGNKQVLGLKEVATEKATVVTELLEDLVDRRLEPVCHRRQQGLVVRPSTRCLAPPTRVQRCRRHKARFLFSAAAHNYAEKTQKSG